MPQRTVPRQMPLCIRRRCRRHAIDGSHTITRDGSTTSTSGSSSLSTQSMSLVKHTLEASSISRMILIKLKDVGQRTTVDQRPGEAMAIAAHVARRWHPSIPRFAHPGKSVVSGGLYPHLLTTKFDAQRRPQAQVSRVEWPTRWDSQPTRTRSRTALRAPAARAAHSVRPRGYVR